MEEQIRLLFREAIQQKSHYGIDQLLLAAQLRLRRSVTIFEKKIDAVEIADELKVGISVNSGGRWGFTSLEFVTKESLEKAILSAKEISCFQDADPDLSLAPMISTKELIQPISELQTLTLKNFERIALDLEIRASSYSHLVKNIPHVSSGCDHLTRIIMNSAGADVMEKNSLFHASLSVMASGTDERLVNVHYTDRRNDFKGFSETDLVREVAGQAIARVNPRRISSGVMPIIFDPRCAAELLSAFQEAFSGDLLYRKLARLEGKLGQSIASKSVSIKDSSSVGLMEHLFDAEGTLCQEKWLIHEGNFENFLHNRYTAKKAGCSSTGNASGGVESLPRVSPTNLFWDGNVVPAKDILSSVNRGLLICELDGALVSPISGDFSYAALGYLIENGQIQYPVADFTIAGNFFELLQRIEAVGDDLKFFSPHALGSYGGRSLLISGLDVSGDTSQE